MKKPIKSRKQSQVNWFWWVFIYLVFLFPALKHLINLLFLIHKLISLISFIFAKYELRDNKMHDDEELGSGKKALEILTNIFLSLQNIYITK